MSEGQRVHSPNTESKFQIISNLISRRGTKVAVDNITLKPFPTKKKNPAKAGFFYSVIFPNLNYRLKTV